MIKYGECLTDERTQLSNYVNILENLNEKINYKEIYKEELESQKAVIENYTLHLNQNYEALISGKKRKRKLKIKSILLFGEISFLLITLFNILNFAFSIIIWEKIIMYMIILACSGLIGTLYYKDSVEDLIELESKYNINDLMSNIFIDKEKLLEISTLIKKLDVELNDLNAEKNDLKIVILELSNRIKSKKQTIDEDFQKNYGQKCPIRTRNKKGE